jgi:hypothetical protein
MRRLVIAVVMVVAAAPQAAVARPVAACPVLPRSNPWNQRVDGLPRAAGSDVMVARMGIDRLHADFSDADEEGYGIPYQVVDAGTPRRHVTFDYADESDPGPYPIPRRPRIEAGSDRHLLALDRDTCTLYELFAARRRPNGSWHAGSGAIFDLRSNDLRPAGWTSADAAGLPILPGLARHADLSAGGIDHALRITIPVSQRAYLWPARHHASDRTAPWLPPMGLRLRVRESFDISGFPPQARAILLAGKRYGFIVADNGSGGYISGAPHRGWDDDDLHTLHDVPASALEVVDTSSLPGHPQPRQRNTRIRVIEGVARAQLLHTAAGPVTFEAVRDGRVVRRVRAQARQGYVRLRMQAVPGARYRVRLA